MDTLLLANQQKLTFINLCRLKVLPSVNTDRDKRIYVIMYNFIMMTCLRTQNLRNMTNVQACLCNILKNKLTLEET